MIDVFGFLLDVVVVIFPVASMLSVGLSYSLSDIVGPLRAVGKVVLVLVANFVLVPLLAWGVAGLLSLEPGHAAGLALLGVAAGAPFLIKLTEVADGDLRLSTALLLILLPGTVVVMPLVVPLIAPQASVSPGAIAGPLLLMMLLPLIAGLVIRWLWPDVAARLQPPVQQTSTISLVVLIIATVVVNLGIILELLREPAILAAFVFILGSFAIGYLMGGSDADAREVLGLGTGQRNIAAATVVAAQIAGDPDALVMVVVVGVVGQVVLFPIARVLRRQERRRHARV